MSRARVLVFAATCAGLVLCLSRVGAASDAGHTAPIRDLAVDPENRYLAAGSEDKTVWVWDLSMRRPLGVIKPPAGTGREGSIYAVAISPDGNTLACGGYTGRRIRKDQQDKIYYAIYIYQRKGGKLLHTLSVPYVVEGLLYSRDGAFLVSTSRGSFQSTSTDYGAERIFNTHDYSWARDAIIPNEGAAATIADFDARGRLLLLRKFGTWIAELKGSDFRQTREIPGIPTAVKVSPDGSRIAIAFADSTLSVYSGDDLSLLYRPDVKGIGPAEAEFTEGMDLAAASLGTLDWSADGTVLYYSGGRTCVRDSCFVRKWSDGGRGAYTDITVATSRVTRLVALRNGGVAYAAVGPALGVVDRLGARTSFFASKEPPVTARKERASEPPAPAAKLKQAAGPTLSDPELEQLRELHGTVTSLVQQRRYRDALPAARRAAAIVEEAGDPTVAAAAQALVDLAHVQYALGQYRSAAGEGALLMEEYREALSLYQRAGPILEHSPDAERQDMAPLLEDLGTLLRAMNRYDEAADVFRQVLALRKGSLGSNHLQTAKSVSDLAAVRVMKFTSEKRFAEAFSSAQAAVEEAESTLPPDDPNLGLALADLAEVYRDFRASYVGAATRFHERALAIRKQSLGTQHWEVVASLRAVGEVEVAQKRYAAAVSAYEEAFGIEQQALGADHPALATFMANLAELHQSLGQYADAESLYRHALEIREKEGEPYRIAHALEDLGELYRAMGRTAEAEPLYTRALSISEDNMGPNHFTVGEAARSLGTLLRVKGDYAGAQPLYQRAVAIHRSHSDIVLPWALRDLAALATAQGDDRAAVGFLTESLAAQEPIFRSLFRPDREERQLEAIQSPHVSGSYWFFLWLVARRFTHDRQAVHDAAALVLRRKALVYDAQSRAMASWRRLSPEARRARDQLSAARAGLSALLLHKPRAMSEAEYRDKLTLQFEKCSELESTLDQLAPRADYEPLRHITVESVAAALPKRSALVEFVRIPDFDYPREDFDFPRTLWDASWRYLAFVLRQSGDVSLVDLGSAKELEGLADRVFRDMHDQNASQWNEHLKALHARLWTPLGIAGGDIDKVMISPDGTLSLVPFAALIDDDGTFLLERYELAYVTTGRELLDGPPSAPLSDLLLVANPDFDARVAESVGEGDTLRSGSFVGKFRPLPGTAQEAEDIPSRVPGTGERTILAGAAATKSAVKAAKAPRILHLATHGFFLEDQKLGMSEAEYETPLVRSGLAFAGANRAAEATEGDDGLLTALEISGMDLAATELVVLSACDTGLGEVRSGEGVLGLRRAFALAGAQNLLMSLWGVSDALTAKQMKYFYTNRQKMAPAEALRQAQLSILRELRAARDGDAPPQLWAPFIIQGGHALIRR